MSGSVQCHKHLKTKRYYIQFYWKAKYIRIEKHPLTGEYFYSEQAAEKQLHRLQNQVEEGTFDPVYWKPNSPVLMQNYALAWLDDKKVTQKTWQGYQTAVVKYIVPFFSGLDIRHLRAKHIRKFKEHLETICIRGDIRMAVKGVYNNMSVLRTMLQDAYRDEDIIRIPPFPVLSQGEQKRPESITFEQQQILLDAIPERDRAIFDFGMEFGLRIGEARALQKDCISKTHVTIKRAFSDNLLKSTKTGITREPELTAYAKEILSQVEPHLGPFVFVRKDGKPYTNKNLNKLWKDACKKTGIQIKLYNAMRHSLGCQLLDMGLPLDHVQEQLGHTDIRSTKRYAVRAKETLTKALEERRAKVIPMVKNNNST